jgi:uncharacterized protein
VKLPDVCVLIYAHREDQAHHRYFRERLEAIVGSGEPFGLTPLVAGAFVRIVTTSRFPGGPTPLPQALAVIDALVSHPNAHWVNPGRRHWELVTHLCRGARAAGKLVADAQHAALAIEHAATWISRDADFAQFVEHGLIWEPWMPEAGPGRAVPAR